ncbi:LicD family protein [Streptococcus sp.]|nr:LicD family protein [Streptococcus sp.]MDY3823383.1 LicD family protein [Streptococcus sp.]
MNIKDIQNLEFKALSQLNEFCSKHNITFYLRGGSVMGAIKYKGFVPWDDDVDIAIPRDDFNRLIQLSLKESFSSQFEIISYHSHSDARCYFPRVYLKKEYQEELNLPSNNHIGVAVLDILPLDGAPSTKIGRGIYYLKIYCLRILGSLATANMTGHKWYRQVFLKLLSLLQLQKLYSSNDIYQLLDNVYSRNDVGTSKFIGTITGSLYSKEIFPREIWGDGTKVPFEDGEFLVPEEYDIYLKKLYGDDYLTTIPKKKDIEFKKHIKEVD